MYDTQPEIDAFFEKTYQFKFVRKLGEGAFGLAVLVFDEVEKLHKVFKLPKNQRTTEALLTEGENLRKLSDLSDPHIIKLHQYGKVRMEWNGVPEDRYYINMAFGGTSLRAIVGDLRPEVDQDGNSKYHGSGRRLPVKEALQISIDVCGGLEAAHGFRDSTVRIIHRDIKPENILIDDDSGVARITDFGISRVIDRSAALVSFAGTLLYMDPECFHSRGTIQADLYSLGIVMYEMLTGDLPFPDFQSRTKGPPRPASQLVEEVSAELSDVVQRTLANNVDERYESATELLADLKRLRACLEPLPDRYVRLSELPDGRLLCDDLETKERVAIRLTRSTAPLTEFARQCATLENLNLPNVNIASRHARNQQFFIIVSPPPRGAASLAERFRAGANTIEQLSELCQVSIAVCETLTKVHAAGICHGYLSPWAISLTPNGPCLDEIGNSVIFQERCTAGHAEGSLAGFDAQLAFLSPQILGAERPPNPKDDIYSLGAILYALASGRVPLDAPERERVIRREPVAETPCHPRQANALVPPSLADVIVKALHWNPHDRFQTVEEMAAALRSCRWPNDVVDALLQDALAMYQAGGADDELLRACELIDKVLVIDPGNGLAHATRGVVYFRNQSYDYAVIELQKAAQVAPSQDVFHSLGQSLARASGKRNAEAVEAFRRALEFGATADIEGNLARALHALEKNDDAVRALRHSIALEPDESVRERRRVLLKEWTRGLNQGAALASDPNPVAEIVTPVINETLTEFSDSER